MIADLRLAARSLARSPAFAFAAVLTLALGLAGGLTVYRLVDSILLHPIPYGNDAALVAIQGDTVSYPAFQDLERESRSFASVAAYRERWFAVAGQEGATLVSGAVVTGRYFEALRVPAAAGRLLQPLDETSGDPMVAVVSHGFFRSQLGGNAAAIGSRLVLNGAPVTVVGVLPERFRGLRLNASPDLYVPVPAWAQLATGPVSRRDITRYSWQWLTPFGRLGNGVTVEAAQAELSGFFSREHAAHDKDAPAPRFSVVPLASDAVGLGGRREVSRFFTLLGIAVALGLAVACSNVASLLLSRAISRERDLAVRQALGASRLRLVRPLFLEGLLVAGFSAGAAFVLSGLLPAALARGGLPEGLSLSVATLGDSVRTGLTALLLGLAVAAATTLAAARRAARTQVVARLKGTGDGPQRDARPALLALQLGVSVLLVAAAGIALASLASRLTTRPGYDVDRLAYLSVETGLARHDESRGLAYRQEALRRLRHVPGVVGASATLLAPIEPGEMAETFEPQGGGERGDVSFVAASAGYFTTIGVPLLEGRDLAETDVAGAPGAAVLNEAAARRYFPGVSAVGRRFRLMGRDFTVAGIARDWKQHSLREAPPPLAVVSLDQIGSEALSSLTFVVRTTGDPAALLPALHAAVASTDPAVPATPGASGRAVLGDALLAHRLAGALLGAFGVLAAALVLAGAYGLASLALAQRSREIGVRLALGAAARDVARLVAARVARPAAVGIALGLLTSLALLRVAGNVAPEARGAAAVAMPFATALGLLAITLGASALPARRATRIDPASILRQE